MGRIFHISQIFHIALGETLHKITAVKILELE